MELKVFLKARAKDVFEELLNSILQDIKTSTGQTVTKNRLCKDFSYQKIIRNHVGYDVSVEVQIKELISPTKYCAIIKNPKGTNTIEYVLCDRDEGVDITYKESYSASSTLLNLNYILASLIYSRSSKNRMRKQFAILEQRILGGS